MDISVKFIKCGFKTVSVLKKSPNGLVELVLGKDNNTYIRKTIPYTNLPYEKLKSIHHPVLPKIYYTAQDEYNTYVIEEHINAVNLQEFLDNRGTLDEKTVTHIALQICDVLRILHSRHILHRDIKPSNIILKEDGSVKLIDFGAAKVISADNHKQHDTRILGTPGFAPPEQYGFSVTDVRSDFYALGMTIKTLLGNEYHGKLLKVIKKCIEFDPKRRIASARELKNLLLGKKKFYYGWYVSLVFIILLTAGIVYYIFYMNEQAEEKPPVYIPEQTTEEQSNTEQKKNIEKQEEKPQTQKQKSIDTPKPPNQNIHPAKAPVTGNIVFVNRNWNKFLKIDGSNEVKMQSGLWPEIVVKNEYDEALNNPQIDIYFTDFGIKGRDGTEKKLGR